MWECLGNSETLFSRESWFCLLPAAREYPALWEQVCRSMGLVARDVIASQKDTLVKQFTTEFIPSPIDQQVTLMIFYLYIQCSSVSCKFKCYLGFYKCFIFGV